MSDNSNQGETKREICVREAMNYAEIKCGSDQIEANLIEARKEGWSDERFANWLRAQAFRVSNTDAAAVYGKGYPIPKKPFNIKP